MNKACFCFNATPLIFVHKALNEVYSALYPIIEAHRADVNKQTLLAELGARVQRIRGTTSTDPHK